MKLPGNAVLLGGKSEHEALRLFKLNFARPWEVLRFEVRFRLPEDDPSLPADPRCLWVYVIDPWTGLVTVVNLDAERLVTAASDPKQFSAALQQASDMVRRSMGQTIAATMRDARAWGRLKARRDRRRADGRKD